MTHSGPTAYDMWAPTLMCVTCGTFTRTPVVRFPTTVNGSPQAFCSEDCYEQWISGRPGTSSVFQEMFPEPREPYEVEVELGAFGKLDKRISSAFEELEIRTVTELRPYLRGDPPPLLKAKGVGKVVHRKLCRLLAERDAMYEALTGERPT